MFNQGMAFLSVNAFEGPRLKSVIAKSVELASKSPYYSVLPEPEKPLPTLNVYDPSLASIGLEELREYALCFRDAVQSDRRVQLESGMVLVTIHTKALSTSKGIEVSEAISTAVWEVMGVAREGDRVSDFDYQCEGTHEKNKIQMGGAAQRLEDAVIPCIKAREKPQNFKEVILSPGAVSSIAAHLAFAATASQVQKDISALRDNLGQNITSPLFTVCDDGLKPDGLASASFDREGVPHQTTPLIHEGVLTSFLHDSTSASRAGCESTGNAAGGYRSRPEIESTNLVVTEGEYTLEELIADTRRGIFVTRLSGVPDILTGDFSFIVKNSIAIQNGELSTPVKETVLSGNVYTMLRTVTGITGKCVPLGNGHYPYIRVRIE